MVHCSRIMIIRSGRIHSHYSRRIVSEPKKPCCRCCCCGRKAEREQVFLLSRWTTRWDNQSIDLSAHLFIEFCAGLAQPVISLVIHSCTQKSAGPRSVYLKRTFSYYLDMQECAFMSMMTLRIDIKRTIRFFVRFFSNKKRNLINFMCDTKSNRGNANKLR